MVLDIKCGNGKQRATVVRTMLSGNSTLPLSRSAVYVRSETKNRMLFGTGYMV